MPIDEALFLLPAHERSGAGCETTPERKERMLVPPMAVLLGGASSARALMFYTAVSKQQQHGQQHGRSPLSIAICNDQGAHDSETSLLANRCTHTHTRVCVCANRCILTY